MYTYKELKSATEDFSLANKIGEGGFGSVYKVHMLFQYNIHIEDRLRDSLSTLCHSMKGTSLNIIMDFQGRLKNGNLAAIKVLSAESRQGVKEFMTEIKVISEVEHENLVKLYGCCVEDNHRILVYNYLENNSLSQTLLGNLLILFFT